MLLFHILQISVKICFADPNKMVTNNEMNINNEFIFLKNIAQFM